MSHLLQALGQSPSGAPQPSLNPRRAPSHLRWSIAVQSSATTICHAMIMRVQGVLCSWPGWLVRTVLLLLVVVVVAALLQSVCWAATQCRNVGSTSYLGDVSNGDSGCHSAAAWVVVLLVVVSALLHRACWAAAQCRCAHRFPPRPRCLVWGLCLVMLDW